jgi:hypothetical protein
VAPDDNLKTADMDQGLAILDALFIFVMAWPYARVLAERPPSVEQAFYSTRPSRRKDVQPGGTMDAYVFGNF